MGMMDNYQPVAPSGYAEGVRDLVIESIETKFTNEGKEYKVINFLFMSDKDKGLNKKLWDDEYTPRKLTEIVKIVGLDPNDLFAACKAGNGDNWLSSKLVGRHGEFDCRKGRPNKDGKQYLEPMTPSEIEYMEWRKAHPKNGTTSQSSNEPPIDSYQGFKDDMPSDVPF